MDDLKYDPIKLMELLSVRDITQVQLANALGYDEATVSRIINGKQPFSHRFAIKAAVYFEVPFWWFIRDREPANVA